MGLGTVIAGIFGGRQTPSLGGLSYTPATVAGGAAVGASAGSLATTLTGTVSYAVLSGALAVNASTGALTTTGTAPSSGSISARVIADNGAQIVGAAISVPVQAVLGTIGPATASFVSGATAGTTIATLTGKSSGSTLSIAPNDGRVLLNSVQTALVVGMTASSVGSTSYTITETLSGATGSPKSSTIAVSVTSASVTPIAPQNATSATFQEVVMVDLNRCFTDVAGTAACTGVGQKVACIRDVNGVIAATQSTAAAQPTLVIDSQSGNYALSFNGTSSYLKRANTADVMSLFTAFALDFAGKRIRPAASTLFSYPSPASGGSNVDGYNLIARTQSGLGLADQVIWGRQRTSATEPFFPVPLVVGHTDVIGLISDGTNTDIYRSGVKTQAGKSPITFANAATTVTGTPATLDTTHVATVGCSSYSDGSVANFAQGLILGWACSSGTLAATEIPGISQFFVNRAAQKQTLTGWISLFFQGDDSGAANERAAAHSPVMKVHTADVTTRSEYRPTDFPATIAAIYGDWGLATDGTALYATFDSSVGNSYVYKSSDGVSWSLLATIDITAAASAYLIGPSFARNVDNSIYTDPAGCAYIFGDGGKGGNGILYVKSVDNSWATGGAWGPATLVPGFTASTGSSPNQIDPTVMRDASGVWHMAISDYAQGTNIQAGVGQLRHATCPAGLPTQTWTLDSSVDVYGAGLGCEGPQFINLGTAAAPSFALAYDKTGGGYNLAPLPNGLGSAMGAATPFVSDDIMEQGELVDLRLLPNFADPLLQATTTPRPNKWPGKGLLISGNMGDAATLTGGNQRANGWGAMELSGNGGSLTCIANSTVADPNGDLTASTYQTNTSSGYAFAACNTLEIVGGGGSPAGFSSQHTFEVWMRGHSGGEVIGLAGFDSTIATRNSLNTSVTLTTTWQKYTFAVSTLATAQKRQATFVGQSPCTGATFDVWGACFK